MKRPLYILRLALVVLLPLLLALAPAMAQTVVYQGKTTPLSVVEVPGHTYAWEIYSDLSVDFATVPGNCPPASATFVGGNTGVNVNVQWLKTGIYFFKVTARDAANCAMNLKVGMVKVMPPELEAVIAGATLTGACQRVALDASQSIGDIVTYEWSPVDTGGELTLQSGKGTEFLLSATFTGTLPAYFRVRLKVTDRKGNTHSNTITINVDSRPVADVVSSGKLEKDGSMIVDGTASTGTALSYKWTTSDGKITGQDNEPTVKLFGEGNYKLTITDNYGCMSYKDFKFPLEINQINVFDDYARTSWAQDITINVLANDTPSVNIMPGTVEVVGLPTRGETSVNVDGSITYMPRDKQSGRDQFVYKVCNEVNKCGSAQVIVDTYDAGVIASEGFSPNGDGLNDKFVVVGLENYPKSQLYVYTRSGTIVYQSVDYQSGDWDGGNIQSTLSNQQLVPSGTYYYILKLGGTNRSLKGFVFVGY